MTWALESLNICTFIGSCCAKYLMFDLKKYRGVIFHDTEEWYKIWRGNRLVVSKLTRGIWQILTWALESLKNFPFNGLLLSKVYIVPAKKVKRSYLSWHWRVMQNLKRNWLVVSKLTWEIWQILTWALESLRNFCFNGLLLSKIYIAPAKKVKRSYLSWHWRVMQNLKRNWLVVSKLTWGIWRILTRALESLKNFHFNRLLLIKVYIVWAKKSTEELSFVTLKSDAKFEEKLTCGLKNDMSNLANEHSKLSKLGLWWDPFAWNRKCISLKFPEELFIMAMKNDTKIEEELTCRFQIDTRNLTNFDLSTRKAERFAF